MHTAQQAKQTYALTRNFLVKKNNIDIYFSMQLVTFEVPHKPGYRLRMRMGIHTGSCVAGVVGTKIPHYSVFGETVEIATIMEASGEPMKIQVNSNSIF